MIDTAPPGGTHDQQVRHRRGGLPDARRARHPRLPRVTGQLGTLETLTATPADHGGQAGPEVPCLGLADLMGDPPVNTRLARCGHDVPTHPGRPRRACNDCAPPRVTRRLPPRTGRPVQCALPDCSVEFLPPSAISRFCPEHRNAKCWKRTEVAEGRHALRMVTTKCAVCQAPCLRSANRSDGRRPTCGYLCRNMLRHGTWPRTPIPLDHPCRRSTALVLYRPVPLRLRVTGPAVHQAAGPARFVSVICRWCDTSFIADREVGAGGALYCTARCLKRAGKVRRSAFERRGAIWEPIAPVTVYRRDKWRCGICGRAIRPDLRPPHPRSATLDHIVPRSENGDHTYANVRAAHRICNSLRSDGGGMEQLALIG